MTCDQKINSLKGDQSVSETGKPCLNWNEVQESSLFARFQKFSIPTHNKCRNPNKDGEGPWCYVKERSNIRKFKLIESRRKWTVENDYIS